MDSIAESTFTHVISVRLWFGLWVLFPASPCALTLLRERVDGKEAKLEI